MGQRFVNNARTVLAAGISDSAASITVTTGQGDLFPVADVDGGSLPSSDDWFKAMITDASGIIEVVAVRSRAGGSDIFSNVLRGQDGTSAQAWGVGAVIFLGLSAADFTAALAFAVDREWDSIPPVSIAASAGNKTATTEARGRRINTDGSTVTVPVGVFDDGQIFTVYNNGATARNLLAAPGVTMRWENGATGTRSLGAYAIASVYCVGENEFRVAGAGVS